MYLFFLLVYFDVHGTKIVLLGKKNSLYDIRTSANGSILSKINQTNLQKLKNLPNLKESQNQSFVFFQKIKSHLTWGSLAFFFYFFFACICIHMHTYAYTWAYIIYDVCSIESTKTRVNHIWCMLMCMHMYAYVCICMHMHAKKK